MVEATNDTKADENTDRGGVRSIPFLFLWKRIRAYRVDEYSRRGAEKFEGVAVDAQRCKNARTSSISGRF